MTKQTEALKLAQGVAMNREDIIRMAREAGIEWDLIDEDEGQIWYISADGLQRFAALVAAAERERIKSANAPEIERINDALKKLSEENTKLWGWYHDAEQHLAILQRRTRGETK